MARSPNHQSVAADAKKMADPIASSTRAIVFWASMMPDNAPPSSIHISTPTTIQRKTVSCHAPSGRRIEPLEPNSEPIAVRSISRPRWKMKLAVIQVLECLEHGPVVV